MDRSMSDGMKKQLDTASYQGLATFAQRPFLTDPKELDRWMPDIAVVGAPWDDSTTNRPGARFGPRALRAQAYGPGTYHMDYGIEIFEELEVVDYGDAICSHGMWEASRQAIEDRVHDVVSRDIVPLVIGGDHAITYPSATAVARHFGFGEIGMVHFDAHADTAEEIDGNYASHGTPMRRLIESGAIKGANFVQVGLRGYWPPKEVFDWMGEQEMKWHTMNEIYERGIVSVIDQAITEASTSPKGIYLSVDIDVLDPGFAPGTGTPEPGGLAPVDLLRVVRRICRNVNVVAVDIVEVSPPFDHAEVTINNAHRVALEAIAGMAMRRRDLKSTDLATD